MLVVRNPVSHDDLRRVEPRTGPHEVGGVQPGEPLILLVRPLQTTIVIFEEGGFANQCSNT